MSDFKLTPGFVKPEPDKLPLKWAIGQLGSLCSIHQGGKLGLTKETNYRSSGVPAYSAAGQDGFVDVAEYKGTSGVVLSAIGANCGRCFFADGDWTTLANIQAIIPRSEALNAKYLFYRVNREAYWTRSGSAQPFIKPTSIKSSWLAYPANPWEQEKIAIVLSSIDSAIEKTEALIAKYQQIKAGLMHDLFTRGVTADGKLRPPREQAPELYQETSIGWIPKEWDTKALRTVCLEISDGAHYSVSRCDEGVPFLFVSCVRNGQILWDNAARISPETYEEISRKSKPYKGMILFTVVGSYGHVAHVPSNDPFGFERNIAYLKPRMDILEPKFLTYWLSSNCVENQVERLVIGNAQKVLTLGNLGKVIIPYLKQEEQKSIVTILESIDVILGCEQQRLDKLINEKSGLMSDLLTGKVRVAV